VFPKVVHVCTQNVLSRLQARNQGRETSPRKIFAPLDKCVGHTLKLLDIAKKFGPLSENFSPLLPLDKCVGHTLKLLDIAKKFGPLSENFSPLLVSQDGYGPGRLPSSPGF